MDIGVFNKTDIVKIADLEKWHQEHPDAKRVRVDHGEFGYAVLIFNYINPSEYEEKAGVFKFGQYDGWGNFHFIDSDGTYHICYPPKKYRKEYKLKNFKL